jgi:hypothetical protein
VSSFPALAEPSEQWTRQVTDFASTPPCVLALVVEPRCRYAADMSARRIANAYVDALLTEHESLRATQRADAVRVALFLVVNEIEVALVRQRFFPSPNARGLVVAMLCVGASTVCRLHVDAQERAHTISLLQSSTTVSALTRRPLASFLAVDPVGALDVDGPAVDSKAAVQHPVAVAAVLAGKLLQALAQALVAVVARLVAQGAGAHSHQPQGLALAQAQSLQLPHDLAPCRHGHYFRCSASRIAASSSIGLTRSRLILPFSASSAFSLRVRHVHATNLAFQA